MSDQLLFRFDAALYVERVRAELTHLAVANVVGYLLPVPALAAKPKRRTRRSSQLRASVTGRAHERPSVADFFCFRVHRLCHFSHSRQTALPGH